MQTNETGFTEAQHAWLQESFGKVIVTVTGDKTEEQLEDAKEKLQKFIGGSGLSIGTLFVVLARSIVDRVVSVEVEDE